MRVGSTEPAVADGDNVLLHEARIAGIAGENPTVGRRRSVRVYLLDSEAINLRRRPWGHRSKDHSGKEGEVDVAGTYRWCCCLAGVKHKTYRVSSTRLLGVAANRPSDPSQSRAIVQRYLSSGAQNPKLLPQLIQVDRNRLESYFSVGQRSAARHPVAYLDRAVRWPLDLDRPARPINRAQRILKSSCVGSLFTNLDVCHQTKQRATPVGSSPGVGTIESAVAGRQANLAAYRVAFRPTPAPLL